MHLISGITMNAQFWAQNLLHEDKMYENAFLNVFYEVKGKTYDESTQSLLTFSYSFDDLGSAESYYDEMKNNHPNSLIKLYEKTHREVRVYF